MNYYNKSGYAGDYRGKAVYVIDKEDYTEDKLNSKHIYAIRHVMDSKMDLVFQGYKFAIMNCDGTIANVRKEAWMFKKKKKEKKKEEKKEEVKIDIDNYDFSVDFSEYEAVVNGVFENLSNWWEDLAKEGS